MQEVDTVSHVEYENHLEEIFMILGYISYNPYNLHNILGIYIYHTLNNTHCI